MGTRGCWSSAWLLLRVNRWLEAESRFSGQERYRAHVRGAKESEPHGVLVGSPYTQSRSLPDDVGVSAKCAANRTADPALCQRAASLALYLRDIHLLVVCGGWIRDTVRGGRPGGGLLHVAEIIRPMIKEGIVMRVDAEVVPFG